MASRDHQGLVAFADFKRVSIRPLQSTEAHALIRKYSGTSGIADKLIERLAAPENASVHEFLVNPLLVSLLFKSFEYKATIPLKKHVFYWQVYEARLFSRRTT
jgi:predicted NACHT family NTPase